VDAQFRRRLVECEEAIQDRIDFLFHNKNPV
jgi:hypothetical protein